MFTCICGRVAFYSDEMELLGDEVTEIDGIKQLVTIRKIKYYTCVNCDKRWIYNATSNTFVLADGGGLL